MNISSSSSSLKTCDREKERKRGRINKSECVGVKPHIWMPTCSMKWMNEWMNQNNYSFGIKLLVVSWPIDRPTTWPPDWLAGWLITNRMEKVVMTWRTAGDNQQQVLFHRWEGETYSKNLNCVNLVIFNIFSAIFDIYCFIWPSRAA